ncbi:MAG TPA: AI-2E family transporter [Solirubrobacteraceae bacterium]|nr:AI-2E family transporter [Solirubrobacteraceae bacterium]
MAAAPTPMAPDRGPVITTRAILRVVLVVLTVVLTLYLIYLLRQPLTWIFIAGFLAIALSGPVNILQRHMRRGFAIAIVYVALILIPFLLGALLIPPIVEQLNNLINNLPQYVADLQDVVERNDTLRQWEQDYNITAELQKQASTLPGRVGDAAGILSDIGLGLVNSVFAGVTILVLSLFMIGSGRSWLHWFAHRQGPDREEWFNRLFDRIGNAVGNYVAGALGQALIAGVLAYIVLRILGVPYAGSLAVIIFLLDLVPLVGATLGAIVVGVITLFNDFPTSTIIWIIWSIVYQQVENSVIQPRIQARAVQVHPFVVLTSVLFGSTLFGVLGALLAIPVAAAIQISIHEYNRLRNAPDDGAVVLPPPDEPPPPAGGEPAPAT